MWFITCCFRVLSLQIKVWRRQLHKYDQDGDEDAGPGAVLSVSAVLVNPCQRNLLTIVPNGANLIFICRAGC